jgi:hypothetical protein
MVLESILLLLIGAGVACAGVSICMLKTIRCKPGSVWRILPGRVNPRGQFDREMRFVVDGPHGKPLALTDDEVADAEHAYRQLTASKEP